MTACTVKRVAEQLARTYMLDASDAEHARLIDIARRTGDIVRELCALGDIGEGARVVDVGCGPIGALLDLADIVGPPCAQVFIAFVANTTRETTTAAFNCL